MCASSPKKPQKWILKKYISFSQAAASTSPSLFVWPCLFDIVCLSFACVLNGLTLFVWLCLFELLIFLFDSIRLRDLYMLSLRCSRWFWASATRSGQLADDWRLRKRFPRCNNYSAAETRQRPFFTQIFSPHWRAVWANSWSHGRVPLERPPGAPFAPLTDTIWVWPRHPLRVSPS